MPETLPLDDGGPLYHPDEPVGFHPSLRAAGHLLAACESVHRGTARSLREEVLPLHPQRPRAAALAPDSPLTAALRTWAAARHLVSPYVLEALLLTLSTWHDARRRLTLLRHDLQRFAPGDRSVSATAASTAGTHPDAILTAVPAGTTAPAADGNHHPDVAVPELPAAELDRLRDLERCCCEALTGWGPWIEVLTRRLEDTPIAPLLLLGPPPPHLAIPRRDLADAARPLTLELPPWNPEIETWDDFESRLRSGLDSALPVYRRRTRESFLRRGFRPVPVKTAAHHFRWLALRQLRGWRPSRIARRHGVHRATVHAALTGLSRLLELPLRPVKRGPEEL